MPSHVSGSVVSHRESEGSSGWGASHSIRTHSPGLAVPTHIPRGQQTAQRPRKAVGPNGVRPEDTSRRSGWPHDSHRRGPMSVANRCHVARLARFTSSHGSVIGEVPVLLETGHQGGRARPSRYSSAECPSRYPAPHPRLFARSMR